jgi:hypothetical protein
MRLVVSLLTAVCVISAAEASATDVGTTQSQAAPSPGTLDMIRQPSLLRQKLTGNCTTTCQWIGRQQYSAASAPWLLSQWWRRSATSDSSAGVSTVHLPGIFKNG